MEINNKARTLKNLSKLAHIHCGFDSIKVLHSYLKTITNSSPEIICCRELPFLSLFCLYHLPLILN